MSTSQKRVVWAFVLGIIIVSGAFIMSNRANSVANQANLVTPIIERKHIAVSDTDQNSLPDWQDNLFGDEEIYIGTSTATYTPPTTVTGTFAIDFFERIMNSKLFGAFGDSKEEVIQKTTEKLFAEAQDEFFVTSDITSIDNTENAVLRSYGNQIASILLAHQTEGRDELTILNDVLRSGEEEKLQEIKPIADAYRQMVLEMTDVSVPAPYVAKHLDLLNALNAVYEDVNAMQNTETDPMYTFLRMKRYEDDVLGLSNAVTILFDTLYLQDNVRWSDGEPTLRLMTFTE